MSNPWDKIFTQEFESAYRIATENYLQSSNKFDLRARAIASLLLKKYDIALQDLLLLKDIEKQSNLSGDGTYMEIGLCFYALNKIEEAIEYFRYPVSNRKELKYTSDISVPPIVLFYMGLKLDRPDLIKLATKELQRLSKFKTVGPNYILDQISAVELNKEFENECNEIFRNRKECKVEFYKAVKELQNRNQEKYKMHINNCVTLTGKFLEFEYFIAKLEFDKLEAANNN